VPSLLHLAVKLVAQRSKETSEDDDEASASWRDRMPVEMDALIYEKISRLRALDAAAVAGTCGPGSVEKSPVGFMQAAS
jgi:hypothetical protein